MMKSALQKRPGVILICLILLLTAPIALNCSCFCDEPDHSGGSSNNTKNDKDAIDPEVGTGGVPYITATFAGEPPNCGFIPNEVPIYIYETEGRETEVKADYRKDFEIKNDEYWTSYGTDVYTLRGTMDEKTGQMTATLSIVHESDQFDFEGKKGNHVLTEYTGTLVAHTTSSNETEKSGKGQPL